MRLYTFLSIFAFFVLLMIRPVVYATERVSVSSSGGEGNDSAGTPSISADGLFVAFSSAASNLVPGDTNSESDILVHDRESDITERVSVSSTGVQGNNSSESPSISADGRFVAFQSSANNLVTGDTNSERDIFVHDRTTGITERVSISSTGTQGNSFSSEPSISADGRFVAFNSDSSNLTPGDTNGQVDVFINDNTLSKFNDQLQLSVVVKPSSDVARVNQKRRFRANFTNHTNQTLTNCKASVVRPVFLNGQRQFNYYSWSRDATNPVANAPIDIGSGDTANIYLVVVPRVALQREIRFDFTCDGTQAIPLSFENTVLLTSKTASLIAEDFIKLDNDNRKTELVIDRNSSDHWSTYVVSVKNTGVNTASVTLNTNTPISKEILRPIKLCETESSGNYRCINPLDEQIQITLVGGESTKVIVFAHANSAIAQRPVTNRIFLEARDQAGELVAKNSIGVYTSN